MVTHRLWYIDEIVRNILGHLPTNSACTLARCARVSHSLSEPALDQLWFKLSGLLPVFRLLPASLLEIQDPSGGPGCTFVLRDFICDEDWSRLTHYTRRVRRFDHHYSQGPGERLGEQVFAALVQHAALSGTTLFPRLQELSWLQFSHVAQCLPFLSPSVRRVTIYVQTPSTLRTPPMDSWHLALGGYTGLLQILDARTPSITELSLEGIDFQELAPPVAFSHLRTLHLGAVSTPTTLILSYCSQMPRLTSLSLALRGYTDTVRRSRIDANADNNNGRPHADTPRLSALEALRISGAPSSIEHVFAAIDSPSFHRIAFAASVPEHDAEGWARCTRTLAARFATSLRSVRAECQRSRAGVVAGGNPRPFAEYVQPLLALKMLEACTIVIEDPVGVSMEDADVEAMATAWRRLASLGVTLRDASLPLGENGASRPSVVSLAVFARYCAELQSLSLPISQDVSALDAPDGPPSTYAARSVNANSVKLHHVWFAGVRFTTRAESERVARFMRWWFPRVELSPMVNAGILRSQG